MAMAMAVSLPALAAGPRRNNTRVLSLRGVSGNCSKLGVQQNGGSHLLHFEAPQLRKSSVSCSVAPAKEGGVPELTASRTTVSPFNVLVTGSTKGEESLKLMNVNCKEL